MTEQSSSQIVQFQVQLLLVDADMQAIFGDLIKLLTNFIQFQYI